VPTISNRPQSMTALYTALVPIMPMPPIQCGSSYGMMSLPFTEWTNGALSRSEKARSSSPAPRHPAPHMITTLPAWSTRRAISATSSSLAESSARSFRVATLEAAPCAFAPNYILRKRQMGDATPRVGGRDRLMNDGRRLSRGKRWFRL